MCIATTGVGAPHEIFHACTLKRQKRVLNTDYGGRGEDQTRFERNTGEENMRGDMSDKPTSLPGIEQIERELAGGGTPMDEDSE